MKYTIQRLNKRYSYSDLFQYYVGFSRNMSNNQGPEKFNEVLQWFTKTYGWSAEIRQYATMLEYHERISGFNQLIHKRFSTHPAYKQHASTFPESCNNTWSWSNNYDDLRVYVATDRELTFFQLAHPIDQ